MSDMKKLTKPQARAMFKKNVTIYIKPSKVPEIVLNRSPWLSWYEICKASLPEDRTFDHVINEFTYYNCCQELGLIANYYVKLSSLKKKK